MNEDRLREALRAEPTAPEREAEQRAWPIIREAYEQRSPARPTHPRRTLALAIAGAVAIAGLALSPAGAEVREWIADTVEPGLERAAPTLDALPGGGRLLVESDGAAWTVAADGSLRSLGAYDEATWSPEGPFAAVVDGPRLLAVVADPDHPLAEGQAAGAVRWSIPGDEPIIAPRWSPSGYRVAYISGGDLRVVAGDGTGDRLLAREVSPVAPAWLPGAGPHRLAFVAGNGEVRVMDVDKGEELWTYEPGPGPGTVRALQWTPDGARLAALGDRGLSLIADRPTGPYGPALVPNLGVRPPADGLAISPRGDLAMIRLERTRDGLRSELILRAGPDPASNQTRLFAGPGRFTNAAFSPDGEWILLAWKDADQWVFIRPGNGEVRAVSDISEQLDPGTDSPRFPEVQGWCCR